METVEQGICICARYNQWQSVTVFANTHLGAGSLSIVQSRKVSIPQRSVVVNRYILVCLLYGGCPLFGLSVIRSFIV